MSISGKICFYSKTYPNDVLNRIEKLVDLSGPGRDPNYSADYTIWYSHKRLTDWEDFQESMNTEDETPGFLGAMIATINLEARWKIIDTPDWRSVVNEPFLAALERERCLKMSFWNTKIFDVIEDAMTSTIPEDIRGDFHMGDVSISIGEHDLYDSSDLHDPTYFGRPLFSYSLEGQGSPLDWDGMREAIANLAEIQALKKKIEEFAGPLELCAFWG